MVVGGDERKQIDYVMTKLRSFTEQTNVSLFLVCHLRRPTTSDKGFEDGLELPIFLGAAAPRAGFLGINYSF